MIAKPHIKPTSAGNVGMRLSRSVEVRVALENALQKHKLTLDRTAKVIDEALTADKTVIIGKGDDAFADVVPDHGIRLKAADMLHGLMGIKQGASKPTESPDPQTPEQNTAIAKEIRKAMDAGDTVKLNQIILEKKDGS